MSNNPIFKELRQVFADSYALYLKTQRYHWNVTGPHFQSYHTLFEAQYTAMIPAIDVLAERLRALGESVPVSFDFLKEHATISFDELPENAQGMIADLVKGHQKVISHLTLLLKSAQQTQDSVTEALATDRLTTHAHMVWMLKSSLDQA